MFPNDYCWILVEKCCSFVVIAVVSGKKTFTSAMFVSWNNGLILTFMISV